MRTIDKINYYLTKENKNGADLCEYLGVSSGVYSQWNTGRTHHRKSKLPIIAEYLSVEVSDIQGDGTNKKEKPTAQGGELISDLPENIQELISICLPSFVRRFTSGATTNSSPNVSGSNSILWNTWPNSRAGVGSGGCSL